MTLRTRRLPEQDAGGCLAIGEHSSTINRTISLPPALKWHAHAGAVAVAKLKIGDYYSDGNQWWFHFGEKGGKVHQVPARDDLQKQMKAYIEATKLAGLSDKAPLFRSAMKRKCA